MEHFEEQLNRRTPKDPPEHIQQTSDDRPLICDPPTGEDMQAIKQLKNAKSAGHQGIPAGAVGLPYPHFKI